MKYLIPHLPELAGAFVEEKMPVLIALLILPVAPGYDRDAPLCSPLFHESIVIPTACAVHSLTLDASLSTD
jgi:hypothetical protein